FDFVRQVNTAIDARKVGAGDRQLVHAALADVDQVLGVLDPAAWATGDPAADPRSGEIDALVQARDEARRKRDFAAADRLRQDLVDRGVVLEDTPQGTRWKWRSQ
ncbi:MAG TPA: cysteine--tRNA ligase, partial [Thermoanaerobaculia bacterium]